MYVAACRLSQSDGLIANDSGIAIRVCLTHK
jgi:hypothetical protein